MPPGHDGMPSSHGRLPDAQVQGQRGPTFACGSPEHGANTYSDMRRRTPTTAVAVVGRLTGEKFPRGVCEKTLSRTNKRISHNRHSVGTAGTNAMSVQLGQPPAH